MALNLKIALYRGLLADLEALPSTGSPGVLALATDTNELYVDQGSGIGIGALGSGAAWVKATGIQGPEGPQGEIGPQGPTGATGPDIAGLTSDGADGIDVSGSVNTSKVSSAGTELVLEQTGDMYGATRIRLRNRDGANGAVFECVSLDLVDFGFLPSSGVQGNFRLEHRGIGLINAGNAASGEFQAMLGGGYAASFGRAVSYIAGSLGIGIAAPKSALHVVGLPVYANNAAALAGGLTAGAMYRTGGDPDAVCVVH